ncbi:ParB N-terminal domain-containing protein [Pseudomonas aeruginosa]|nr:ParB N-terminal domain-containing protein [Pseudomonas aeruginosa]EKU8356113.1 ParB N-terminal domain-containing protein [Pseudomonas aeruginosa]EKU8371357.1 ParB N-terminal domain-containing protein [Pseudomonas aeruginosa]EKU9192143.1 ParB N-terminal domain-containing protein [Pseudomonas aeruginosa]EKV0657550.1 ParB N-terminal domain-containing protein [Pseudomonas aeruginosa]
MTKLASVSLNELHFDPDNPRLPVALRNKPDEDVIKYLLLECNLIELMLSIGEHGFFLGEPLLVVPRAGGGYTVVEGNRRLGALKLLASSSPPPVMAGQVKQARESARQKVNDIPVLEFDDRDNILSYLGYRHITGIKEWGSLAKARYLKQLRERHADKGHADAHKALAKEIGSKSSHVAKLLTGLKLLEHARDTGLLVSLKLEEDDIPFSLLTTGIGYPNICDFIGIKGASDVDAAGLKEKEFVEFFGWVFDKSHGPSTVLGESRNFDKLSRVVANDRALEVLRHGEPLAHADLYTEGPLEALRHLLREAESSIKNAQFTLSAVEGLDQPDLNQAERIKKSASALFASIQDVMSGEE